MTFAARLAEFATRVSYEDLSEEARRHLKARVLDSIGCALGAAGGEPVVMVRAQIDELGGKAACTLIGGGRTAPDRAALYNGALVRYLDYNDSYLAAGETCHPSDNLASLLAAAEYAGRSGRDLMTALAVAYQIQCRLSDVAPVRSAGFDHTVQGSYAVAAGVSRLLGLSSEETANAIAICGTAFNALRVTRTGSLSHWKGLAYPMGASCCIQGVFLARQGVTGPQEVFEGDKGFMDSIAGHFELDWRQEDLESVTRTILKKYNAEIHSQSAIEAVLGLRHEHGFESEDIRSVEVEIFDVAFNIIGGGEEGDKTAMIDSKERADHSLPYILAAALLDGRVTPEQYVPERINRADVQKLLRRVSVRPDGGFSRRFPKEMPCRIKITLGGGRQLTKEVADYPGFVTRPMPWDAVAAKFETLSAPHAAPDVRRNLVDAVANLEKIDVRALMGRLGGLNDLVSRRPVRAVKQQDKEHPK